MADISMPDNTRERECGYYDSPGRYGATRAYTGHLKNALPDDKIL